MTFFNSRKNEVGRNEILGTFFLFTASYWQEDLILSGDVVVTHFCFVFMRFPNRILARIVGIVTRFCGFPQWMHGSAEIVPLNETARASHVCLCRRVLGHFAFGATLCAYRIKPFVRFKFSDPTRL
jgi:hypothetical protein